MKSNRVVLTVSWVVLIGVQGLGCRSASANSQSELRELYRGARAQAMGNAFTAVADDEEALYYNPAGLAGNDSTTFQYLNSELEISGDVVTSATTDYKQFNNLSGDSVNLLMGKDVYFHANYTPIYLMHHFAVGIIADQQLALISQNKAMPQFEVGYQTTNGIQLGYGISLTQGTQSPGDFRVGVGFKYLFRRGGYFDLSEADLIKLNKDTLRNKIGGFGSGVGFDLGTQYIYHLTSVIDLQAGAAWTEIGDVHFSNDTAETQKGNLSTGLAVRYHFAGMEAILSYDYRHINESCDARLRNHLGAEIALPLVSFYAGLNQIYPTFGAGFHLWDLIRVNAVSYAEEMSTVAHVNPERRYLVQISMGI